MPGWSTIAWGLPTACLTALSLHHPGWVAIAAVSMCLVATEFAARRVMVLGEIRLLPPKFARTIVLIHTRRCALWTLPLVVVVGQLLGDSTTVRAAVGLSYGVMCVAWLPTALRLAIE